MRLLNFTELSLKEQKELFKIRTSHEISQFCINKKISLKEHLAFIKSLKNDKDKLYLLVLDDEKWLGVISFRGLKSAEVYFGLYKISKQKLGKILMQTMLDTANNLKLKSINAKVLNSNTKALSLYKSFDFKVVLEQDDYKILKRGGGLRI